MRNLIQKHFFSISITIYVVLNILFLIFGYAYQVNPDTISFIDVAEKYLNGDFQQAVNGYWGPVFSWLMIPFLVLKIEPIISGNIIQIFAGIMMLIGVRFLIKYFKIDNFLQIPVFITAIVLISYFGLFYNLADTIFTSFLIFYFLILVDKEYINKYYYGILCGLLGVCAYYTKSYGFIFFIIHFSAISLIYFFKYKKNRKIILINYFAGLLIFTIISSIYITAISSKYTNFYFGTSGKYNWMVRGPDSPGTPLYYSGFLPPSTDSATSSWEDPTYFIDTLPDWSTFDSMEAFEHHLRLIFKNVKRSYPFIPPLMIMICAIYLLFIIYYLIYNQSFSLKYLIPLLTIFLYIAPFFLVFIEDRYLWLIHLFILLMGAQLLQQFLSLINIPNFIKRCGIFLFCFSFLILPLIYIAETYNAGKHIFDLGQEIKQKNIIDVKTASNKNWADTAYLAYFSDCHYYGIKKPGQTLDSVLKELKKYQIDYYLMWDPDEDEFQYFNDLFPIKYSTTISNLIIFSLKNKQDQI